MAAPLNDNHLLEEPEDEDETVHQDAKCCRFGPKHWCKKYFWEGQNVSKEHQARLADVSGDTETMKRLLLQHRRILALVLPALLCHICWWAMMIKRDRFHLYDDKYPMAIVMVLGSMVAGMSSEGGGAVAFPVMTLAFQIKPSIARDFSVMIQSIGMTCASFSILLMRVRIEWQALVFCSIGGSFGLVFGLHFIDPLMSAPLKKMVFTSIFFAFASVLLFINRNHKRPTFDKITPRSWWKVMVLVVTGVAGGVMTSFAGNGLDVATFSILTLLFRLSEKIATPTSVILMALNSVLGFYWRGVVMQDISQEAWEFLAVCAPVVVIGAPVGSILGSHFHRLVLAGVVILLDIVALIGAYAIIPLTPMLIGVSLSIIVGGVLFFGAISVVGQRLHCKAHIQEQDRL